MANHTSLKTIVFCLSPNSQFPLLTIKELLSLSLNSTSFVTHTITYNDIFITPWIENTNILILDQTDDVDISLLSKQLNIFQEQFSGCVVSFDSKYSSFCHQNYSVKLLSDCNNTNIVQANSDSQGNNTNRQQNIEDFISVYAIQSGVTIVCDARLLKLLTEDKDMTCKLYLFKQLMYKCGISTLSDSIPNPKITAGYLVIEDLVLKNKFLGEIQANYASKPFKESELKISFLPSISPEWKEPSHNFLPISFDKNPPTNLFDTDLYFQNINTNYLGRALIYSEVTTSSLDILNPRFVFSLSGDLSLLVLCSIQTQGRGRGPNQWVSPSGCLMFSHLISIKQKSFLFARVTLLQHIISVAIVHSIRSIQEYENVDLCLKWPNDIYYGNSMKLGGVLVKNYSMGSTNKCIFSVGMNVATEKLFSLNSVIDEYNMKNKSSLPHLRLEYVLARTLNILEIFLEDIEAGRLSEILELYYKYWLHADAEITVWNSEDNFIIQALDEYGYLTVKSKNDEQVYSIQPDGNSFDMLKGCITKKV
ncbi:Biotin--protein ligase [Oopsacas minuta]|uniref:Biotin--protein ligase n=1 Tax=Oopsacas minuta TaxID=111878 RepID=A0AAV7JU10_9METZ|nr:Biotin--protein ligase [Oopsacas minuta]